MALTLNARGQAIVLDSVVYRVILANYKKLLALVDADNPKSAYLIQELIPRKIKKLIAEDDSLLLKNCIEDELFHKGTDYDQLYLCVGIQIRDRILSDLGYDPVTGDKKEA